MATLYPAPSSAQPPPDLPNMPEVSPKLSDYLRRFSLWCRQGFADRAPAHEAVPGILLRAYDAPAGSNPTIYLLQINSAGVMTITPQRLGSGRP